MKYTKLMKHWHETPTLMETLVQKHYLFSRGFLYIGDSSIQQTSSEFDKEVMRKLQGAEEVARLPFFYSGLSGYLSWQEKIIEGKYQFYAIFPEEKEEKSPDTWPGGFQAAAKMNPPENPASPYRTIKRKLPSELLYELSFERLGILYENVHNFYFEHNQKRNETKKFKHTLTIEDLLILSRMENKNILDTAQLRGKQSFPEDRKVGKYLDDHLSRSPLVTRVSRSPIFTLSMDALDGIYAAVVHKNYLRSGFQESDI